MGKTKLQIAKHEFKDLYKAFNSELNNAKDQQAKLNLKDYSAIDQQAKLNLKDYSGKILSLIQANPDLTKKLGKWIDRLREVKRDLVENNLESVVGGKENINGYIMLANEHIPNNSLRKNGAFIYGRLTGLTEGDILKLGHQDRASVKQMLKNSKKDTYLIAYDVIQDKNYLWMFRADDQELSKTVLGSDIDKRTVAVYLKLEDIPLTNSYDVVNFKGGAQARMTHFEKDIIDRKEGPMKLPSYSRKLSGVSSRLKSKITDMIARGDTDGKVLALTIIETLVGQKDLNRDKTVKSNLHGVVELAKLALEISAADPVDISKVCEGLKKIWVSTDVINEDITTLASIITNVGKCKNIKPIEMNAGKHDYMTDLRILFLAHLEDLWSLYDKLTPVKLSNRDKVALLNKLREDVKEIFVSAFDFNERVKSYLTPDHFDRISGDFERVIGLVISLDTMYPNIFDFHALTDVHEQITVLFNKFKTDGRYQTLDTQRIHNPLNPNTAKEIFDAAEREANEFGNVLKKNLGDNFQGVILDSVPTTKLNYDSSAGTSSKSGSHSLLSNVTIPSRDSIASRSITHVSSSEYKSLCSVAKLVQGKNFNTLNTTVNADSISKIEGELKEKGGYTVVGVVGKDDKGHVNVERLILYEKDGDIETLKISNADMASNKRGNYTALNNIQKRHTFHSLDDLNIKTMDELIVDDKVATDVTDVPSRPSI